MTDSPKPDDATPFSVEFPDAAGYPDGTGTLDEGTASTGADTAASEEIVDDVAPFDEGDDRDS